MSTMDAKNDAKRLAFIRAEAQKLAGQMDANVIATAAREIHEERAREWIKDLVIAEVKKNNDFIVQQMKEQIQAAVKIEVSAYCRSVFDTTTDEEHFHMVNDEKTDAEFA